MSSNPPLLPEHCPSCGSKLVEKDLTRRFVIPAGEVGELPADIMEHTPKQGCGKWLWRRQKEKTT